MATEVTDLTLIETAAESFFKEQFTQIRKTAVQRDMRNIFATVAITVAIVRGRFVPLGSTRFKTGVTINVLLMFSSAKDEEDRRKGINPLVLGMAKKLARKRLGLNITDILPRGFHDVTSEELWGENKIVYNLEFETTFSWSVEDEDAPDLIGIGVEYFLEPGDDTADAADDITITEEP